MNPQQGPGLVSARAPFPMPTRRFGPVNASHNPLLLLLVSLATQQFGSRYIRDSASSGGVISAPSVSNAANLARSCRRNWAARTDRRIDRDRWIDGDRQLDGPASPSSLCVSQGKA
jgi:hypothetical protein